jgi:dTDP-4-dehydrorhamnose 3,5-epimerase
MWIPPGFAHGFVALTDSADFLYKTTDYYEPEYERCIRWNDPMLAISWPTTTEAVLLAGKDVDALELASMSERDLFA